MKISAEPLIERAAEQLGQEISQIQKVGAKVADQLIIDSEKLARKARYGLRNGAALAGQVERQMVEEVRARPLAYLLVTVGFAAVVFLKIAWDRQKNSPGLE